MVSAECANRSRSFVSSIRARLFLVASCASRLVGRTGATSAGKGPNDELACEEVGRPAGCVVGGAHEGCCGQKILIGVARQLYGEDRRDCCRFPVQRFGLVEWRWAIFDDGELWLEMMMVIIGSGIKLRRRRHAVSSVEAS